MLTSFTSAFDVVGAHTASIEAMQPFQSSRAFSKTPEAGAAGSVDVTMERVVTWSLDARGRVSWNDPVEALMGYRPGEQGFRLWGGSAHPTATKRRSGAEAADHSGSRSKVADLPTALVAPITLVVPQGAPWNFYQLLWTVEGPDGAYHRLIVEATPSSDPNRRVTCTGLVRLAGAALTNASPTARDGVNDARGWTATEPAPTTGGDRSGKVRAAGGRAAVARASKEGPARGTSAVEASTSASADTLLTASDAPPGGSGGSDGSSGSGRPRGRSGSDGSSKRASTTSRDGSNDPNWEEYHRSFIDHTPDGVVIHDGSAVVYANQAVRQVVGEHGVHEIVGKGISSYVHPTSQARLLERVAALKSPGDVGEAEEMLFAFPDGYLQKIETIPIFTSWQGAPAVEVILRDISDRKRAEEMNRYQANLISNMSDAVVSVDVAGNIVSWNQAAERTYGWTAEEVAGLKVTDVLSGRCRANPRRRSRSTRPKLPTEKTRSDPSSRRSDPGMVPRASDHSHTSATIDEDPFSSGDHRHITKAGDILQVRVSVAPLLGELEQMIGWVGICSDLTSFLNAEAARRSAEDRYNALASVLGEGIVSLDDHGHVLEANDSARLILGARLDTQTGDGVLSGMHPVVTRDGSPLHVVQYPIGSTLRTGKPLKDVIIGTMTDQGNRLWLSVNTHLISDDAASGADDVQRRVVCSFSDVTENVKAQQQLTYRANHDELTGLLNRSGFLDLLARAVGRSRSTPDGLALLVVNLDSFKLLNDLHGPDFGDAVLVAVAQRLRNASRAGDAVARLGNDDFAVLCHGVQDPDTSIKIATAFSTVIAEPFMDLGQDALSLTASIGVAFCHPGEVQAEELLRDADTAVSQARIKGHGHVDLFDAGAREQVIKRLQTYDELCRAMEHNELTVFYQPIASLQNTRVVGMEALIRWRHPKRGLIAPYDFIPLAEETGLIVAMGNWVLQQACLTMAEWRRSLPAAKRAHISVNLSARQLAEPEIVATVAAALERSGLPAEALMLEVTETALIDDMASAVTLLAELRQLGIRLAIDDFGTGYSSLGYLKNLPIDVLKIDRTFITDVEKDRADKAIVDAVVRLGHAFDLTVLAEGVENQRQRETLQGLNCDLYQGYLLSRPVDTNLVTFRDRPTKNPISQPTTSIPMPPSSEGVA